MRVRSLAALALLALMVYAAGLVVFYSMSVRTDDEGRPALRQRQHFVTTTKAPLFEKAAVASDKAAREVTAKAPKVLRKAFSTVLCDDGDALPAVVLLMSLLRSGTDAQLIPLLTPRVSKQPEEILRMMAPSRVKPRRIRDVRWPGFTTDEHCRYARFRAFGLSGYDRIIYLDADSFVVAPLDTLFKIDRLGAVPGAYPRSLSSSLL